MGSGIGFTEEDEPNFKGSFYSYTKTLAEKLLRVYSNVLLLRVRMPISDDLNPRNFVTKISKYEHVVNIPNSMSVLHDLLPASIAMTLHGLKVRDQIYWCYWDVKRCESYENIKYQSFAENHIVICITNYI